MNVSNNFTGPSETHRPPPSPPTRRVIYSFDDDDDLERLVLPLRHPRLDSESKVAVLPQRPQRRRKTRQRPNPFIENEAGVEGDVSVAETNGDNDLDGFIVPDDVKY